jgi:RNA polymerase sigma-70 factor (ECF subfamily)
MIEEQDDAYLVSRAREGYLEAFETLVRRHQGRAYRLAVRLTGDSHEAEDAVQEAFVDAWRGLPQFAGDAAFGTWFYRIVVNRCIGMARRRKPRPIEIVPDTLVADGHPGQAVEQQARDEALRRAIQQLPSELRAPLVMVTFADFTYEEAAAVLHINPSTVRGRIARARKSLLEQMREWA